MIVLDGMEIFMLKLIGVFLGVMAVIMLIMAAVFRIQEIQRKKLSKELAAETPKIRKSRDKFLKEKGLLEDGS